jgi:uncharacterized protein YdaU (DUF1376 family)
MHYYQFNIGDYKSHTEHLSEMEDLTYRRLLDWYYLHECPIPLDELEVARQIRMRSHSDCIAVVLREYFELTSEGWIHHRANKELAKAGEKSTKASQSAKARWDKKANKNKDLAPDANALRTQSEGNATHNTEHITQDTLHKESSPKEKKKKQVKEDAKVTRPDSVSEQLWNDWLIVRKKKDAPLTETAWDLMVNQAAKAGWPIDKAIEECCLRSWISFKADWVSDKKVFGNSGHISSTGQINKRVISGLTRGLLGGDNNVQLLGN